MSILYDEEQQAIATESRRALEARVGKDDLLPLLQTSGQYHESFWTTAKEQGWTALALPEAYGGHDLGLDELGLIAHQAGRTLSGAPLSGRSEEHTSELQSLMRNSSAVFCVKKKKSTT